MTGIVHSIETFGTVDGPGIRLVVFLKGCPLRCAYCHNPDTWHTEGGTVMTAGEIMTRFHRNRNYYRKGGITVTGGEPLLQPDFLLELFRLAKAEHIHTCIDTSGITYRPGDEKLDALMALTDLVLLDIKHTGQTHHRELTGQDNAPVLAFARYLRQRKIPVWIRHVLVPGVTDDPAQLKALGQLLAELDNVQALEVLPYHTMGVDKYRHLGLPYRLEGVPQATQTQADQAKALILRSRKAALTKK